MAGRVRAQWQYHRRRVDAHRGSDADFNAVAAVGDGNRTANAAAHCHPYPAFADWLAADAHSHLSGDALADLRTNA